LRYFFHIGYNGINYRGWQKLPGIDSVQNTLETLISQILKTPVNIIGCGRTDAQVHASQFFFHVDLDGNWDFDLLFRLNKNLPADIAVFDIIPMEGLPHARLDATQRSYNYFIHTYKDPFLSSVSSLYQERNLDLVKMKEATSLLTKYNDYRGFCKNPSKYRTTICQVSYAELCVDNAGDRIKFTISANRFLGSMIRILVHQILLVGLRKLTVDEFEYYLIAKQSPKVIIPAYPQGLYLSKIDYPFLDIPPRSEFLKLLSDPITNWQVI